MYKQRFCLSVLTSIFSIGIVSISAHADVPVAGYKKVFGTSTGNLNSYIDKDGNYIVITDYSGESYGVLVRCFIVDGLASSTIIKSKVVELISKNISKRYQKQLIEMVNLKFKMANGSRWKSELGGEFSECFVEVAWQSESICITVKCVK